MVSACSSAEDTETMGCPHRDVALYINRGEDTDYSGGSDVRPARITHMQAATSITERVPTLVVDSGKGSELRHVSERARVRALSRCRGRTCQVRLRAHYSIAWPRISERLSRTGSLREGWYQQPVHLRSLAWAQASPSHGHGTPGAVG